MRYGFPVVAGVVGGSVPAGVFGVTPGYAWAVPFVSVGPMAFGAFPVGTGLGFPVGRVGAFGPFVPFGI